MSKPNRKEKLDVLAGINSGKMNLSELRDTNFPLFYYRINSKLYWIWDCDKITTSYNTLADLRANHGADASYSQSNGKYNFHTGKVIPKEGAKPYDVPKDKIHFILNED